MSNNNDNFLGGLLIGGAIGAAIGLLMAPRAGEETRGILRSEFNDRLNQSRETVKSKTVELKDRAREATDQLKDKSQQIAGDLENLGRETISKLKTKTNGIAAEIALEQENPN